MTELEKANQRIAELEAQLEAIGAVGVNGPLMTPTPTSGAADLRTERYFTVVYKLTDANVAKYLSNSNRDWVTYVYADSMAELASLKELSAEPEGAVYAELPNSLRTSDISGDPSDRHWASGYYNADHMRDFADHTHALRIAPLSANAGSEPVAVLAMRMLVAAGHITQVKADESLRLAAEYTHPSPPEGIAGWTKASEQLPPCRDDQDYIGINTAGFAGVFNAVADVAGNVYCMMETAEESVSIMSDLSIWKPFTRPLPASPTIKGESK